MLLSVISVVFLWSVSIDKAYLNILVVISNLLGQSILGMRQLPRMNILVLKKRLVASSNSIIREKVNVVFSKQGQCRVLKTKMIENQEITTL
jgi:hypothetical protein